MKSMSTRRRFLARCFGLLGLAHVARSVPPCSEDGGRLVPKQLQGAISSGRVLRGDPVRLRAHRVAFALGMYGPNELRELEAAAWERCCQERLGRT